MLWDPHDLNYQSSSLFHHTSRDLVLVKYTACRNLSLFKSMIDDVLLMAKGSSCGLKVNF